MYVGKVGCIGNYCSIRVWPVEEKLQYKSVLIISTFSMFWITVLHNIFTSNCAAFSSTKCVRVQYFILCVGSSPINDIHKCSHFANYAFLLHNEQIPVKCDLLVFVWV